jgi:hypothetical protein
MVIRKGQLVLEMNEKFTKAQDTLTSASGMRIMITPPLDKDYWLFRVQLVKDQAVVGFPKFGLIGIGFAIEEEDWNTNLPSSTYTNDIVEHIWVNRKYKSITKDMVMRAVTMIQAAAADYLKGHPKV